MIRGMIQKRKEKKAELQRQKEETVQNERKAWERHFGAQEALFAQVQDGSGWYGRAFQVTQKDYQTAYEDYKGYVSKVMHQWIGNERTLAGASSVGGAIVAGPVGVIAVGAKAYANLNYLREFEKSVPDSLIDLKTTSEAQRLPPGRDDNTASTMLPSVNGAEVEAILPAGTRVALHTMSFNGLCENIFAKTEPRCELEFNFSFDYANLKEITQSIHAATSKMKNFASISGAEVERLAALAMKDILQQIDLSVIGESSGESQTHFSIEAIRSNAQADKETHGTTVKQHSYVLTSVLMKFSVRVLRACFVRNSDFKVDTVIPSWSFDSLEELAATSKSSAALSSSDVAFPLPMQL